MEIWGKKFDDAMIARARARFEKGKAWIGVRARIELGFDELLDCFANDCMSFVDIAAIACEGGMSRQRIHQIYNGYFRDLFPGKRTGHRRRKICILKHRKVAAVAAENDFSDHDAIAKAARSATMAGCAVKRVLLAPRSGVHADSHALLVDGKKYGVHNLRNRSVVNGGYVFSHCQVSRRLLGKMKGLIILQKLGRSIDRLFVVPTKDILVAYGCQKGNLISFSVPAERFSDLGYRRTRLVWREYENAWPNNDAGK